MKIKMINIKLKHYLGLLFFCAVVFYAQNIEAQNSQTRVQDSIEKQVVTIVKPYTPKISDAFKLKQAPSIMVSQDSQKSIKYTIFSIPVASTFTPAKGNSIGVKKFKKEKLFQNYTSIGLGNYGTVLGNLYLNHKIGRGETLGGYVEHYSSQGGMDGLQLEDSFSNNKVQVNYAKILKTFTWTTDLAYARQAINWYGLPYPTTFSINSKQVYSALSLSSNVQFTKGVFQKVSIDFQRFSDAYGSQEYRLEADSSLQLNIFDQSINTNLSIDYLNGEFNQNYLDPEQNSYGNTLFSVSPSYKYFQGDLAVSVGVRATFLIDSNRSINRFYIYPNIEASYSIVNSIVLAYAQIKGDLIQNTYSDFAQINPFISPTLEIRPSSTSYKLIVGSKGKLSESIAYDLNGSYSKQNDKALFRSNTILNLSALTNYNQGNSFGIVYDDVDVFNASGALEFDMSEKLMLRFKGDLYKYSSNLEPRVWNLPDFEASLFLNYQISDKWALVGTLFYYGARQDSTTNDSLHSETTNETLDSFFDANFQLDYQVSSQWGAFLKVNNMTNSNYSRWNHYPVQGFQILGGASYKFDF
tara:strand:+ start:2255 stop:4000 length:1746 start_codon:yes stop_codon:yes gene_type:complete